MIIINRFLIKKKLDYSNELTNILLSYFNKNIEKSNVFSIIFILKNYKSQFEKEIEENYPEFYPKTNEAQLNNAQLLNKILEKLKI